MAKKPKAPEQDNPVTASDTDILSESQQSEQMENPPFEPDTQPPEVAVEETTQHTPDISEEAQPLEPISFEAFKAAQEAAAAEMPVPEEEDTRQEWEKPLVEIETEQQTKRRGRPPKASEDKETSGQVGPKSDKSAKAEKSPKQPKSEKATKPPKEEKAPEPPAPPEPVTPPEPIDATRPGEVEQIVYLNLSELHPFKDHPFQVKTDEEMRALVSSVQDKGVTQPAIVRPREDGGY